MTLTELKDSVEADAALHLPDLIYNTNNDTHQMSFEVVELSRLIDDQEHDLVGVRINTDRDNPDVSTSFPYIFTKWSRSQLLSLLGTKEKWFSFVEVNQQADELNHRMHALNGHNLRTMRAVDEGFPVRIVRGLVSSEYSDIPNTEIMKSIIETVPEDSGVLRAPSGLTDRAFYAYIMSPTPITIPGTRFFAYPGAVVKNSEVGYTSLWVIPALVFRTGIEEPVPVVVESTAVLRRIHRGRVDLPKRFKESFEKCASTWASMAAKIPVMASKSYMTEDAAIAAMERLLTSCLGKKEFVQQCQIIYKSKPRTHTALDIFEAIVEACSTYTDRDESYAVGAIAGAVLYKLVLT